MTGSEKNPSTRNSVLVDAAWVADHLSDPSVVLIEVDDRPALYHAGHPPGAHLLSWRHDLQDPVRRDLPAPAAMTALWQRLGITTDTTVVFYGDLHNWLAAYGYWLFRSYGLTNLRLLDGGRQQWISQQRPLTTTAPSQLTADQPPTPRLNPTFIADRQHVTTAARNGTLLDVRTPQEYTGEWLTEPEYPGEAAHRPGHIPGATNLPWDTTVTPDGLIRPTDELQDLFQSAGITRADKTVTYCRIGERSAHTWLLLHDLLGHPHIRNYNGSWTEWGSMTGMPIQLGAKPGTFPPGQDVDDPHSTDTSPSGTSGRPNGPRRRRA